MVSSLVRSESYEARLWCCCEIEEIPRFVAVKQHLRCKSANPPKKSVILVGQARSWGHAAAALTKGRAVIDSKKENRSHDGITISKGANGQVHGVEGLVANCGLPNVKA